MNKAVIFDLDGTLADTSKGIVSCYRFALSELCIPSPASDDVLINLIGGPLVNNFMNAFNLSEEKAMVATKLYRERYSEIGYTESELYPGIEKLLKQLKDQNYVLGIATLKAKRFAIEMMKKFGVFDYFDSICGVIDYDISKGELIAECMNELKVEASNTVYIGDSINDAKGAQLKNVDFIAVTYGFGFKNNLSCNDYDVIHISDDVEDLMSYFRG